jgi:beta-fructofuranosidase
MGPDGLLRQRPAAELQKLRDKHFRTTDLNLRNGRYVLKNAGGDTVEIRAALDVGDACNVGLNVRSSTDGKRAVTISYDGQTLDAAGVKVPLSLSSDEKVLTLQVFLDKSVMEIFANDGYRAVAKVIYPEEKDVGIALFATGGKAHVKSLDVWQMKSIWAESTK